MNQHAMWKYCIAHKWGRMHIYTEYARTKHIYIYINIYIYTYIYIHIYRQFSVFITSVGLAALAPIICRTSFRKWKLTLLTRNIAHAEVQVRMEYRSRFRGWINFDFDFEFELTQVIKLPPRFPVRTVKNMKNNLASRPRSGSFYVVCLVGFDYRGSTAKGCRCAHSPLLTEIRCRLMLRGVARAVHVHSCLRKLLFVTTPQLLL